MPRPEAASAAIRFEPVAERHHATLGAWLALPHVRQWWGDPDEELALIRALPDGDGTEGFVVLWDEAPIGFIQSWKPARFEGTHWAQIAPWLREVPEDTVGIDIFLGPASAVGRGRGPKVIEAFAGMLFAKGAPRLIIDPDKANTRAVRAYAKAGFRPFGEWSDGEGETTVLMERHAGERPSVVPGGVVPGGVAPGNAP